MVTATREHIDRTEPADHDSITLPKLSSMARHAFPQLVESTLIPLVLFYATLWAFDVWYALVGALLWSYLALFRRIIRRQRIGGLLMLTVFTLTLRTVISLMSGNLVVYFIQPTIAKVALGAAFLLSLRGSEPIIQRFAGDFVPSIGDLSAQPAVQRCFARLTVMWALVLLTDAALALYLLLSQSVGTYVITKSIMTYGLKGAAILVSISLFRRAMDRQGIQVSYA